MIQLLKFHLANGSFPQQSEVASQLDGLAELLDGEGIEVLRPLDLPDLEQVFARDVGLVIDSTFVRSRTIDARRGEWDGVAPILGNTPWMAIPDDVHMEGGDVVVLDDALFVGVTRRPDWQGLQVDAHIALCIGRFWHPLSLTVKWSDWNCTKTTMTPSSAPSTWIVLTCLWGVVMPFLP